MKFKAYVEKTNEEQGYNLYRYNKLLKYRANFFEDCKLENISPALAIMMLKLDSEFKDTLGGFKESIIDAENVNRKTIFENYFNNNKQMIREKFQEVLMYNVELFRTSIVRRFDEEIVVDVPIVNLLTSMNNEDNIKTTTKISYLKMMNLSSLLAMAKYRNNEDSRSVNPNVTNTNLTTMSLNKIFSILDKYSVHSKEDIDTYSINNEWIKWQGIKYQILFNLLEKSFEQNRVDHKGIVIDGCGSSNIQVTKLPPSMTAEGMITMMDNSQAYPKIFQEYYDTSRSHDQDMLKYLDLFNAMYQ